MNRVLVAGDFDNFNSHHARLLHEASKLGEVYVLLWSDAIVAEMTGENPQFPEEERHYVVDSMRYTTKTKIAEESYRNSSFVERVETVVNEWQPDIWVTDEEHHTPEQELFAREKWITYRLLSENDLAGFPLNGPTTDRDALNESKTDGDASPGKGGGRGRMSAGYGENRRKKCVVTGCYDWFHSGHVRFFEEASQYGNLYVIIGHDENVRLLKGAGHPLFPEDERLYMVQAVQFVTMALISSGQGWLDAEPEIDKIQPDRYIVNEDGDKPEKRQFCASRGIEYIVLKRKPKEGLEKRSSTDLRGF